MKRPRTEQREVTKIRKMKGQTKRLVMKLIRIHSYRALLEDMRRAFAPFDETPEDGAERSDEDSEQKNPNITVSYQTDLHSF